MKIVRTSLALCGVAAALAFSAEGRADDGTKKHDQTTHTADPSSASTQSSTTSETSTMGATQGAMGTGTQQGSSSQPGMSSVPCPTGQQPCDTWGTGTPGSMQGGGAGDSTSQGTYPNQTERDYGTYPTEQNTTPTAPPEVSTTTTTQSTYDPSLYADRPTTYSVRPNRPLLVTGSAIFLGSYAATAIQGAFSDNQADEDNNFIPLAGPWMNLADRTCNLGDCGTGEDVNNLLLIGSGVAQAAGVAIALSSLFIPEEREGSMAKGKAATRTAKAAPKPSISAVPMAMGRNGSGGGIGAVGRF